MALIKAEPLSPARETPSRQLVPSATFRSGGRAIWVPDRGWARSLLSMSGSVLVTSVMYLFDHPWYRDAVAMLALTSAALAACAHVTLAPRVRRWRVRRAFARAPEVASLAGQPRGGRLRLSGVARSIGATVSTPSGHHPLVVRYIGRRGSVDGIVPWRLRWELHSVDFKLELTDGTQILVDGQDVILLPHPPAKRPQGPVAWSVAEKADTPEAWIFMQDGVEPGQSVTVSGTLDFVVDPTAGAASDRQSRLQPVLRAEPGLPVFVSLTSEAAPAALNPR